VGTVRVLQMETTPVKHGITIAELLIAMVMAIVVTTVVVQIWQSGVQGYAQNKAIRQQINTAHTINIQIEDVIHNATEISCVSGSLLVLPQDAPVFAQAKLVEEWIEEKYPKMLQNAHIECDSNGVFVELAFEFGPKNRFPTLYFYPWEW
jgi:type II secretory pathway pseudopilin PulG